MGVASETSVSFLRSAADPDFQVPGSALNTPPTDDPDNDVKETAMRPDELPEWNDVQKLPADGGNPVPKPEKMQM